MAHTISVCMYFKYNMYTVVLHLDQFVNNTFTNYRNFSMKQKNQFF